MMAVIAALLLAPGTGAQEPVQAPPHSIDVTGSAIRLRSDGSTWRLGARITIPQGLHLYAEDGPGYEAATRSVANESRAVAVMHGGWSGDRMLGDTWLWDGLTWTEQRQPAGPSARGGVPAMTYDSSRRKIVMYGGWGDDGPLQDVWEWDGEWNARACFGLPRDAGRGTKRADRAFTETLSSL